MNLPTMSCKRGTSVALPALPGTVVMAVLVLLILAGTLAWVGLRERPPEDAETAARARLPPPSVRSHPSPKPWHRPASCPRPWPGHAKPGTTTAPGGGGGETAVSPGYKFPMTDNEIEHLVQ